MIVVIPLTQNQQTIIDDEFAELAKYKWQAQWIEKMQSYYASRNISIDNKKHKNIPLSRAIMELHLGRKLERYEEVDHINHDTLDNRLENLAVKTSRGNKLNTGRKRNNTSGYKGVSWDKINKKWKVQICANYAVKYIGLFVDILDAARMYDRAYLYFGGVDAMVSCLNFPEEIELRRQELKENAYKWMKFQKCV